MVDRRYVSVLGEPCHSFLAVPCVGVCLTHPTPHPRSVPPQFWNKACAYCKVDVSVLLLESCMAGNMILI